MITISKASDTDREVLFGNAAKRSGIRNPAIVEDPLTLKYHS